MRREVSYYIREKKRTASTELAHVLKNAIGQIDRPGKKLSFFASEVTGSQATVLVL